jgi:hypothetical protein
VSLGILCMTSHASGLCVKHELLTAASVPCYPTVCGDTLMCAEQSNAAHNLHNCGLHCRSTVCMLPARSKLSAQTSPATNAAMHGCVLQATCWASLCWHGQAHAATHP